MVVWVLASATNPNGGSDYTLHASQLHDDLLSSYNKAVPPTSTRIAGYGSQAGTDVALQLRFFKLENVNAAQGQLSVKVWWRMQWSDTRLAWDPATYGNITQVKFHASSYSGKIEARLPST